MKFKVLSKTLLMTGILMLMSGCNAYRSSFSCGDAKGAECLSMDRVDRMISSGEIERFNEAYCQGGKCRGGKCGGGGRRSSDNAFMPDMSNSKSSANIYYGDKGGKHDGRDAAEDKGQNGGLEGALADKGEEY